MCQGLRDCEHGEHSLPRSRCTVHSTKGCLSPLRSQHQLFLYAQPETSLKERNGISPICVSGGTPTGSHSHTHTHAKLFIDPYLPLDLFLSRALIDGESYRPGWSRTHVAKNNLKRQLLLPAAPQYWHYRCVRPHPVFTRPRTGFTNARQATTPVQGLYLITSILPPSSKWKLHDKIL